MSEKMNLNENTISLEERNALLEEIKLIILAQRKRFTIKRNKELDLLEAKYYRGLPVLAIGCCPFCQKGLFTAIDIFGVDGQWWGPKHRRHKTYPPCDHFYLLCGAVNFNGKPLLGLDNVLNTKKIYFGPEVPYLEKEEMESPNCRIVIAPLEMVPGYTAYTIAYFTNPRKVAGKFAPSWGGYYDSYRDGEGHGSWDYSELNWTFDFHPNLEKGQVFWCDPEGDNSRLSEKPIEEFPYHDLVGSRYGLYIENRALREQRNRYTRTHTLEDWMTTSPVLESFNDRLKKR